MLPQSVKRFFKYEIITLCLSEIPIRNDLNKIFYRMSQLLYLSPNFFHVYIRRVFMF